MAYIFIGVLISLGIPRIQNQFNIKIETDSKNFLKQSSKLKLIDANGFKNFAINPLEGGFYVGVSIEEQLISMNNNMPIYVYIYIYIAKSSIELGHLHTIQLLYYSSILKK